MTDFLFDNIQIIVLAFFGICILWVLLRLLGALFRPARTSSIPVIQDIPPHTRMEPQLSDAAQPPVPSMDVATMSALRSSIDNLALQVAALEKRLAPVPADASQVISGGPTEAQCHATVPPVIIPQRDA